MLQSFNLAIKSICSNKMRSFLTMLGIIIGVAAVIILVALVNGQMSYVTDSFSSMGTNQMTVRLINLSSRSVSDEDMYGFLEENQDYFTLISPTVSVSGTVKNGTESLTSTSISGVSEDYLEIKAYELETGRFIQYSDIISRQKVCVMGYYTAQNLFGSAEKSLGENVKINGGAYKVIGVVERQTSETSTLEEGGTDDFLYLPYTSAIKIARNASINNYVLTTADLDKTEEAKTALENFLYLKFKDEDLYTVTSMSELLDSLNSMIAMMSGVLGGIAGISLLVAGVGVMNIMLVSVTERTREIGIRKSLGAKKRTIMQQFVIEAAVTSSIGGLIGILLGCTLSGVIGSLMSIEATPSMGAIAISFSVSVGIGLIFGYMPASRAAKLNPIDALRSE